MVLYSRTNNNKKRALPCPLLPTKERADKRKIDRDKNHKVMVRQTLGSWTFLSLSGLISQKGAWFRKSLLNHCP